MASLVDNKITHHILLHYLLQALLYYLLHFMPLIYSELVFEYGTASSSPFPYGYLTDPAQLLKRLGH